MSKKIIIICRGQSIGCQEKRNLTIENDNAPDILRDEWLCLKCEKKLETLKANEEAHLKTEQEKINNPGKCSECSTKIQKGQYCSSCLKRRVHESFKKSQEKSKELNDLLTKSLADSEESNKQLQEALLEYLIQLEKKGKNKKVEEIEAELKENEAEIVRIKQQIAENEAKKSNNKNYQPINNPSYTQTLNQQSDVKCVNCKKYFLNGETCHYFPQAPNKK
jgi:hypothetical protein